MGLRAFKSSSPNESDLRRGKSEDQFQNKEVKHLGEIPVPLVNADKKLYTSHRKADGTRNKT